MMLGGTMCRVGGLRCVFREAVERWESRAVRTSSCCLLKGPATDPIHCNSRCHIKSPPRPAAHTHSHMCPAHIHPYAKSSCTFTHTHTHTDENVCVCLWVRGDLELLTENKEGNQEKMQPLRINLTTMLRKIPNLTPRNARKTLFLSLKAVKSVLQKQK